MAKLLIPQCNYKHLSNKLSIKNTLFQSYMGLEKSIFILYTICMLLYTHHVFIRY